MIKVSMLKKNNRKEEIIDFIKDFLIIIVIVFVIRAFFIAPFQIQGESMNDNFYDKEFILVNRFTTTKIPLIGRIKPYNRGDVIVFEPRDKNGNLIIHNGLNEKKVDDFFSKIRRFIAWPETTYIKRIIGLSGDTVRIEDGNVYIKKKGENNFIKLNETFLNDTNNGKTLISSFSERKDFLVPDGKFFVMGDNRNNSTDSRVCFYTCLLENYTAFVDEKYIIGKVGFDIGYFSFYNFKFIHPTKGIETKPKFFDFKGTFNYNL